jgi:hypothetical protein
MLLAGEGGWCAWPDPHLLTFVGVSLARLRADCRVERRRQRFGVSAASAIRWRAQERREGDIRPKLQAGDRHSQRIEADAELILSAPAAKSDITLSELREQLRARDGRHRHTLALLQAPQDHAQKKSAEPNSAAVR